MNMEPYGKTDISNVTWPLDDVTFHLDAYLH
jgi:hypothetical protein